MELIGKTAVITGAGGGMGSVLARALKKEGVNLILVERRLSLLDHLTDLIDGSENAKYECDLSSPEEIQNLILDIGQNFSKIDFLYNVAGVGIYKNIGDLSVQEWTDSVAINQTAPFILTKSLLDCGLELVVNFGSGMAELPTAGRVAYCSSKAGLRSLSLALSKELKDVSVVHMMLGSVMTNFGTGGIKVREDLEKEGKKYLTPEKVIEKVIETTKLDERRAEYEMYPEGYESSY